MKTERRSSARRINSGAKFDRHDDEAGLINLAQNPIDNLFGFFAVDRCRDDLYQRLAGAISLWELDDIGGHGTLTICSFAQSATSVGL